MGVYGFSFGVCWFGCYFCLVVFVMDLYVVCILLIWIVYSIRNWFDVGGEDRNLVMVYEMSCVLSEFDLMV